VIASHKGAVKCDPAATNRQYRGPVLKISPAASSHAIGGATFGGRGCDGADASRAARSRPQSSPPTMPRRRTKILTMGSTPAPSNWVRFAEMETIQMLPPRQVGKPRPSLLGEPLTPVWEAPSDDLFNS
jgi:hypothetical protein